MGISPTEERAFTGARKSIVAAVDIKKGGVISRDMLAFKRPGTGIPPDHADKLIGKIAKFDILNDALLEESMLRE